MPDLMFPAPPLYQLVANPAFSPGVYGGEEVMPVAMMDEAEAVITRWPGYAPTPLVSLPELARACGVRQLLYKDESKRFGLGSFKALGGAYAVAALVASHQQQGGAIGDLTVTTATDGNHGRSVAWGAQQAGCRAEIYIHAHVSHERQAAMEAFGARVHRIDGNYEASLAACKDDAEANNWTIVSDTSWEGYSKIPQMVMAGYSLIGREVLAQLETGCSLSHCFLPVGVGGLAAGIVAPLWHALGTNLPLITTVESHYSACFLESIAAGKPSLVSITEETVMAGLSCGEVSDLAWQLLQPVLHHCMAIGDDAVAPLMAALADGSGGAAALEAGECATAGIAALLAARQQEDGGKALQLDADSVVLVIGTEGATDPRLYASMLAEGRARRG